jgi:hypothetical protein
MSLADHAIGPVGLLEAVGGVGSYTDTRWATR